MGGRGLHEGAGGAPWGAPGVPKFLPRSKNILGQPYEQFETIFIRHMSQKSLRNIIPATFGGPGAPWGAGGLHGGPPGVPKFLPRSKNILGQPYEQFETIFISHMSQKSVRNIYPAT